MQESLSNKSDNPSGVHSRSPAYDLDLDDHASPRIMLAMPLFHGWEHVEQTLESIRKQTYRNYRLLISVDGGDQRSHDACLRFADDPRVKLVLHETRLGWAGNINWLVGQLREDYFCYWQHDDY